MAGRRIGGAGGGSDPGKKKSAKTGVAVVIGVSVAVGASGTSITGSATVSRPPGRSSSDSRTSLEISTDDFRSAEFRIARHGLSVKPDVESDGSDCAGHSYGTVRRFFRERPCSALYRLQLEVGDKQGDVILVAVSWVRMSDSDSATAYRRLVDAPGTGNVRELSRDRGDHRDVRYTGCHYASVQVGDVVMNAQAEPVARRWVGLAASALANEAAGAAMAVHGPAC